MCGGIRGEGTGGWVGEKLLLSGSPGWPLRQGAFEEEVGGAGRLGEQRKGVVAVCVTSGRLVVAD